MTISTRITETQSEERSYIYIHKEHRTFFPQIYETFKIVDIEKNEVHDVHLEPSYRIPRLARFFNAHDEIEKNTILLIEIVQQGEIYNIYIDKTAIDSEKKLDKQLEKQVARIKIKSYKNYDLEEEKVPEKILNTR